jgi:integrase/recombinase XerD
MEFRHQRQWQIYDPNGRRKYANEQERRRLLSAAHDARADILALAYLLAFTGCRISEALALTPEHFDPDSGSVTFRTLKRRRLAFRSVPIPQEVCAMICSLPSSPEKQIWPMHRVTAWRHIKALFTETQTTGPMACCRGLRHAFGIHAATRGVPQNLIQRWMGHASPETTAIYLDAVGVEERQFAGRMW